MSQTVSIVDYGAGNLFSVCRAVEQCGATPKLISSAAEIINADRLILPGVGAFADCRKGLEDRGLIDPLLAYAKSGRPFLGICVGMQLLMEVGEEFGEHQGLGLIPGRVQPIPSVGKGAHEGIRHKIPHIGWNELIPKAKPWTGTILADVPQHTTVYFVHSFTPVPTHEANRLADCDYNGQTIAAAIQADNVFGVQFHPEKSGPIGLHILSNFLAL